MSILLEAGADIESRNINGFTPLFEAVWRNKYDTTKYLIDMGARVNIQNYAGHSPLYISVVRAQQPFLELLVASGCSPQNEAWLWTNSLRQFSSSWEQHQPLCDWLMAQMPRPSTLQQVCCRVIRQALGANVSQKAQQLNLPKGFKDKLALLHLK